MAIRVLSGERYNVLATGESVTASPSADSLFPAANLYDGRPDSAMKFSAASTESTVTIDGNRSSNGSLDTWSGSVPDGWGTVGTVAETTTAGEVRSGSAARISGHGGGTLCEIYKDFTVRSGERLVLNGWRRILAAGQGSATGFLQNLDTGNFWDGSTWAAISNVFLQDATNTTYTEYGPTAFTVESFDEVKADTCTLRLTLQNKDGTVTDYAFFDDWFLWPAVDIASVHGHNIINAGEVLLRSSYDNFASTSGVTTRAVMSVLRPSFYTVLSSAIDERYWQLQISTTTPTVQPTWIGELVIGLADTQDRQFNYDSEITHLEDIIGSRTLGGAPHVYRVGQRPRRVLSLSYDYFTEAEYLNGRQLFERSHGSALPVVIVPGSTEDLVIHGRIEPTFGVRRSLTTHYTGATYTITEDPFPVWVE